MATLAIMNAKELLLRHAPPPPVSKLMTHARHNGLKGLSSV